MDPISIAASALAIAASLYRVSEVIKATTNANRTIRSFQIQVNGLVNVLQSLQTALSHPALEQLAEDNGDLWQYMGESVLECKATTDELLGRIDRATTPNSNQIRQVWRNFRSGLSQDDLDKLLASIRTHSINLQLSIGIVNALLSASSFERLEKMLNAIDLQLEALSSARPSATPSEIAKVVLNDNTMQLSRAARSIISNPSSGAGLTVSAATDCPSWWDIASVFDHLDLHEDNVGQPEPSTTGSERGRPLNDAQKDYIYDWIPGMDRIDEASESTAQSPRPNDLVSIFSESSIGLETQITEFSSADIFNESSSDDEDFKSVRSRFSKANKAFAKHQFIAAEVILESSLGDSLPLKPKQQEALGIKEMRLKYAICKLRNGKLAQSEELFTEISKESVQTATDAERVYKAIHCLATINLQKHNFTAAENHCRQALRGRRRARTIGKSHKDYFASLKLRSAIRRAQGDDIGAQSYLDQFPDSKKPTMSDLDEALRSEYFYDATSKNDLSPSQQPSPEPSASVKTAPDRQDSLSQMRLPPARANTNPNTTEGDLDLKDISSQTRGSISTLDTLHFNQQLGQGETNPHLNDDLQRNIRANERRMSQATSTNGSLQAWPPGTEVRVEKPVNIVSTEAELSHARARIKREGFFKTGKANKGLLWASKDGRLHEVNVFLQECLVDINTRRTGRFESQETPLFLAAEKGHLEICARLLSASPSLDTPNSNNDTPLVKAAENGHILVCQLLLQHGAKVDGLDYGGTPLIRAAGSAGGHEPLKMASSHDLCQLLLSKGADINAGDIKGRTALMVAARSGSKYTCLFLLRNGANVDMVDVEGRTALMRAAQADHLDICCSLLDHGANFMARDLRGRVALDLMPYVNQKKAFADYYDKLKTSGRV